MFRKILVANRGEIAIRAFRAAYELGARTVAVFPYEDRGSLHRQKADESYVIGEPGHPVRAYLDVEEIIRVALESRRGRHLPRAMDSSPRIRSSRRVRPRTASPSSARPPRRWRWRGTRSPPSTTRSPRAFPVLRSTDASEDVDALVAQADDIGFPIFVKAVAGGGGRGMRRVESRGRAAARDRRGDARGRRRVRRRPRVPRAGGRAPSAHRGADPRRRDRPHRAPVRARLLGAAASPEGHRDRARRRTSPTSCARRCTATPSPSRSPSATSTPAPSSSSSTRRASAPASMSSSR